MFHGRARLWQHLVRDVGMFEKTLSSSACMHACVHRQTSAVCQRRWLVCQAQARWAETFPQRGSFEAHHLQRYAPPTSISGSRFFLSCASWLFVHCNTRRAVASVSRTPGVTSAHGNRGRHRQQLLTRRCLSFCIVQHRERRGSNEPQQSASVQ